MAQDSTAPYHVPNELIKQILENAISTPKDGQFTNTYNDIDIVQPTMADKSMYKEAQKLLKESSTWMVDVDLTVSFDWNHSGATSLASALFCPDWLRSSIKHVRINLNSEDSRLIWEKGDPKLPGFPVLHNALRHIRSQYSNLETIFLVISVKHKTLHLLAPEEYQISHRIVDKICKTLFFETCLVPHRADLRKLAVHVTDWTKPGVPRRTVKLPATSRSQFYRGRIVRRVWNERNTAFEVQNLPPLQDNEGRGMFHYAFRKVAMNRADMDEFDFDELDLEDEYGKV